MLLSVDYPYYRDHPTNWADRLHQIKAMGMSVVTCYIPWRHHQPIAHMKPDFYGQTKPNRNVHHFLQLCHQLDLQVIIKPGPFVHAELNYGGLPDWVCPLFAPITSIRDHSGTPRLWNGARLDETSKSPELWPLPAPFDPTFRKLVEQWMTAIREHILLPFAESAGLIIAIQIGNEGFYSDGQAAPWAYDYSPSGLAQFARFLAAKYRDLDALCTAYQGNYVDWQAVTPPRLPLTETTPHQLLIDWGEFQAWYIAELFHMWAAPLQTTLPVLVNQNPPLAEPYGLDAWLTRVEPERWSGLTYGFTNWVGDVSANPSAFDRYALVARRYPGVNLEENWGFAELYDAAYSDASTSFYQTLLVMNAGALGFNVYTGVATGAFDPQLTVLPQIPYPDHPPITLEGQWTAKAEIVRWLVDFFHRYGDEFTTSHPLRDLAWGFSLQSVRLDVWKPDTAPRHGAYLAQFMRAARQAHRDYGLINLDAATLADLLPYRQLYVAAPSGLSEAAQQLLQNYLAHDGELVWIGPNLPTVFPTTTVQSQTTPTVAPAAWLTVTGHADVWLRTHPQRELLFVTILLAVDQTEPVQIQIRLGHTQYTATVQAAPAGGVIARVEHGRVTDVIIKGVNRFVRQSVAPRFTWNEQTFTLPIPGDLAYIGGQEYTLTADII